MTDPRINRAQEGFQKDLPAGFLDFYETLHREFTGQQRDLATKRAGTLSASHGGDRPDHLPSSEATESDWSITVPDWARDQRNQMTGPADDAELVVKMLNSGAPGVMLDLEDSMANRWPNLMLGHRNIIAGLKGELTYFDQKRQQDMPIKASSTVILNRVRGLHLSQAGIYPDDELTSASLFDLALIAFRSDPSWLKHPLTIYIPKTESSEEAIWWAAALKAVARTRGWEADAIKAFALMESHPMPYQMEEFLCHLREHILGLNLGRWDYMASLIHFNLEDPEWVLPDRNTIPHDVPFFQRVRILMADLCHKRGALAIGGMTALYPSRENPALNERALAVLEKDKKNEAECFMDGAWTGHPDQNRIAVDQFPFPNQLDKRPQDAERYPDLRPIPRDVGRRSLEGTRAAVRTVIRYRNGVLNGKGASLLDGFMEDLATDRIYRLMIAQRMKHHEKTPILDEEGNRVAHTPEFISRLFDEEVERLVSEIPLGKDLGTEETLREARRISESWIRDNLFDPV